MCFLQPSLQVAQAFVLELQSAKSRETYPAVLQSAAAEWTESETLLLLEAQERYGDSNWGRIAAHVRSKNELQCIVHFLQLPIDDVLLMDAMEVSACPRGFHACHLHFLACCLRHLGAAIPALPWL